MKIFLLQNWFKIGIIIVVLILGFSYISYLEEKESNYRFQQQQEQYKETEEKQKEYLASKKNDCLKIYTTESEKWNNVTGWRFDETNEMCFIKYKLSTPRTESECKEIYEVDNGKVPQIFFRDFLMCKEGEFETSF